jgi:hypothetical protein
LGGAIKKGPRISRAFGWILGTAVVLSLAELGSASGTVEAVLLAFLHA